jgi:GT2 family glycosyltransferase
MNEGEHRAGPTVAKQNRWKDVPGVSGAVDTWARLSVSVVIPAYQAHGTIDLVLAALAEQTYPAELLEIVVVDDGSVPALELSTAGATNVRVVRSDPSGWGRAHACQCGVRATTGDVVLFLDADMVVFRDHVEAQMRIHHALPYAVVIGRKQFVADWEQTDRSSVLAAISGDTLSTVFAEAEVSDHWIEDRIAATDDLNDADHKAFTVFTGATGSVRRTLLDEAGGLDTELRLGEDTELAYRLAQVGGIFVPELTTTSWHLGAPTVETAGESSRAWNQPFFAQRIASLRSLRSARQIWAVPLVVATVDARECSDDEARTCVEALLASMFDIRVELVGPWSTITDERRSVLTDPDRGWHALRARFGTDARVRLVEHVSADAFPSPFLLRVPSSIVAARGAIARTIRIANTRHVGYVRVLVPGAAEGEICELVRTSAERRVRRLVDEGVEAEDARDRVWGVRWADGSALGYTVGPPPVD